MSPGSSTAYVSTNTKRHGHLVEEKGNLSETFTRHPPGKFAREKQQRHILIKRNDPSQRTVGLRSATVRILLPFRTMKFALPAISDIRQKKIELSPRKMERSWIWTKIR